MTKLIGQARDRWQRETRRAAFVMESMLSQLDPFVVFLLLLFTATSIQHIFSL